MTASAVLKQAFLPVATAIAAAAQGAAGDATALVQLVQGLADGNYYGRYQVQPTASYAPASGNIASLIIQAAAWRALVTQFAAQAEADTENTGNFIADLLVLPEAIRLACAAPADALRLLASLAGFQLSIDAGSDAEGQQINALAASAAVLFRRAAAISLARASADYLPNSQQDAASVRDNVCDVLWSVATEAADRFEDASFTALDAVRVKVVNDLTLRGASLAPVTTRNFTASLPDAVVAYRLYADATRADDLVARNNPPHPAFMPPSIEALTA